MGTGGLTVEEAAALQRQLVDERERLVRRAAGLDVTYQELVDAADLEPPDDEHDPDGTTAYERAQVGSLGRESRDRIEQVDTALEELRAGTYGRCDACGRSIGYYRLLAVPGTRRCIDCSR